MMWSALVTLIAQGTRCACLLTRTNEKTRQLQSIFRKGGLNWGGPNANIAATALDLIDRRTS